MSDTEGTGHTVKARLVDLPVEELRYYRGLRRRGVSRYDANMMMAGRFSVHLHGHYVLRAVDRGA